MVQRLSAIFDGHAFLPKAPVPLQPGTDVELTYNTDPAVVFQPYCRALSDREERAWAEIGVRLSQTPPEPSTVEEWMDELRGRP
jgi:hypothetical protein